MKRYLLFAYSKHYPRGGFNDFVGDFDNLDELFSAIENCLLNDNEVVEYLDTKEQQYICGSNRFIKPLNEVARRWEAQLPNR